MNLPSGNHPLFFCFVGCSRISSGVLNGWFSATICMENPNTNIANTTRNLPRSFIKSPMMIAHGPNRWWNERKSKIWTHANKNDRAKHWLRQYSSVGQYSIVKAHATLTKWKIKMIQRILHSQNSIWSLIFSTYWREHQFRPSQREVQVV